MQAALGRNRTTGLLIPSDPWSTHCPWATIAPIKSTMTSCRCYNWWVIAMRLSMWHPMILHFEEDGRWKIFELFRSGPHTVPPCLKQSCDPLQHIQWHVNAKKSTSIQYEQVWKSILELLHNGLKMFYRQSIGSFQFWCFLITKLRFCAFLGNTSKTDFYLFEPHLRPKQILFFAVGCTKALHLHCSVFSVSPEECTWQMLHTYLSLRQGASVDYSLCYVTCVSARDKPGPGVSRAHNKTPLLSVSTAAENKHRL